MKVVTPEQMKNIDNRAIEKGIPSLLLMENAASAVVSELPKNAVSFLVVCGKGNNGGDGYAIARQLHCAGKQVGILSCGEPKSEDAKFNRGCAVEIGVPLVTFDELSEYDVIVDALLGTGVSRQVADEEKKIIEYINNSKSYVCSVDIPSGTSALSGLSCGISVKADKTVTFGVLKQGQLWSDNVGKLVLKSISIPPSVISDDITTSALCSSYVKTLLPERLTTAHKGSCGKMLVVAGSIGMTGAATMCCNAALRTGSGLVSLVIPQSLNDIMEKTLIEAMTIPVTECDGALCYDSLEKIMPYFKTADVLLIGCGLSTKPDVKKAFEVIVTECSIPMVIDADGLNILAENLDLIKDKNVILTPHPVEFARLSGLTLEEINKDKVKAASDFAVKHNVVIVLKGKGTVIALPDGRSFINTSGNEGMATGGSGDVLAGMIASFVGQGLSLENAAVAGVYLHGLSGDVAKEYKGIYSMLPTDMIDCIAEAIDIVKEVD